MGRHDDGSVPFTPQGMNDLARSVVALTELLKQIRQEILARLDALPCHTSSTRGHCPASKEPAMAKTAPKPPTPKTPMAPPFPPKAPAGKGPKKPC